jgi:hypothetical protein
MILLLQTVNRSGLHWTAVNRTLLSFCFLVAKTIEAEF